jgi:hypothetical protein
MSSVVYLNRRRELPATWSAEAAPAIPEAEQCLVASRDLAVYLLDIIERSLAVLQRTHQSLPGMPGQPLSRQILTLQTSIDHARSVLQEKGRADSGGAPSHAEAAANDRGAC